MNDETVALIDPAGSGSAAVDVCRFRRASRIVVKAGNCVEKSFECHCPRLRGSVGFKRNALKM